MRPHIALIGALVLGWTGACDPAGQTPAPASSQPTASAAPSAAPAASGSAGPAAKYADEDLPVAADFEAAADTAIDESNYLEKLDEMEAELGGGTGTAPDAGAAK